MPTALLHKPSAYLRQEGSKIDTQAVVGSNGARVFTGNVDAWEGVIDGFSIINGRSLPQWTQAAIEAVRDKKRVSILTSSEDFPGFQHPVNWGRTVAAPSQAMKLKQKYSDIRVFRSEFSPSLKARLGGLFNPADQNWLDGHVRTMDMRNWGDKYRVREATSTGWGRRRDISSEDLMQKMASTPKTKKIIRNLSGIGNWHRVCMELVTAFPLKK